MICLTTRIHKGPDVVVIVTADMSISVALLFFVDFAPDSYVQHIGLWHHLHLEREAILPCVIHKTERYSREVRDCVGQHCDLNSEVFRCEERGLSISFVRHRSAPAQSFEACLLLVSIYLLLALSEEENSLVITGVRKVGQIVLVARTILCVKARRRLHSRLNSSATRVRRRSITELRLITARRLITATFRRAYSGVVFGASAAGVAIFAHNLRARVARLLVIYHMTVIAGYDSHSHRFQIRNEL
jgi:hypothetical protein